MGRCCSRARADTIVAMEPGTPIPFVVGCGRSGTTVLRLMMNAHPDLAIPPESHFLRYAAEHPRRVAPSRLIEIALASDRFADWGVDPSVVRSRAAAREPRTLAEAADLLFSAYASVNGKARWGDKTPPYVTCMDALATILPDARFVHLIRDGRDVALSFSSVDFGPPKDAVSQAYHWLQQVSAGRRSGARLGPGQYLEMRYEDLVDDPERQLRAVCAFVDLSFEGEMLRFQDTVTQALPPERRIHHVHAHQPIAKGIRNWRTSMPRTDVGAFEAVAGEFLTALGYEIAGEPAPRGVDGRLAVAKVRDRILEARTRFSAARARSRAASRRATTRP
jgi:Sulfotransferase family